MLGGFLGAGKTTTIAKLAKHYIDQGLKVGLVTNDQAYNLVDTQALRAQGFSVGEVPGACFCCKFDDLVKTADQLSEADTPDLIITEPVGSCTDLYATVVKPLEELFGDRFDIGPLLVLLKPEHGLKILSDSDRVGFSPKAAYIFLKQLEEADYIVVNKIDKLSNDQQHQIGELVSRKFEQPVILHSARTGSGFDELISAANSERADRQKMMDVDYQIYAEGEAELGWFNCQVTASGDDKFELDTLVLRMVERIGGALNAAGAETAHLKVLGQTLNDSAIANQVDSEGEAELSMASEIKTAVADLLVNARVGTDPGTLTEIVVNETKALSDELGIQLEVGGVQSFRPAPPEPTHRTA